MDDLTAALAASFEISSDLNKTSAPHPRFSQFKCKTSNQDQDSRRKRLLEVQKKNRFDFLGHIRKLTEDDWKDVEDGEDDAEKEEMEVEEKIKKPGRYYKDQLMLSEWLVEVPLDFADEWLMVVCPVAKRCLVVTNGYSTKAYTKSGFCINSFPSHLPGGNRKQHRSRDCSILDCLYSEVEKTYYILDLMCWNGHTIYDTETEFRFYWMNEKLQECPELKECSSLNPMKFIPLPSFPCIPESISAAVASANFEIDGLLFYHKRTHYMFGSTPLVVWLKPYMLPEILGIEVPDCQLTHRPETYTNYADHMKSVAENKEKALQEKSSFSGVSEQGRSVGRQGKGRGLGHKQVMDVGSVGSDGQGVEAVHEKAGSGRGQGKRRHRKGKRESMEAEDCAECDQIRPEILRDSDNVYFPQILQDSSESNPKSVHYCNVIESGDLTLQSSDGSMLEAEESHIT